VTPAFWVAAPSVFLSYDMSRVRALKQHCVISWRVFVAPPDPVRSLRAAVPSSLAFAGMDGRSQRRK